MTVDNCTFEKLNGTLTPVVVFQSTSLIFATSSKQQSVIVRNSQIINNKGLWDNSNDSHNVGNIQYDILVENCIVSNNTMKGKILPILVIEKCSNVSVNFTILRTNFTNNSAPPTVFLGSDESVEIELNVLYSYFQNSNLYLLIDKEYRSCKALILLDPL